MNTLVVINDAPYGTERAYNALRLAGAVARNEGQSVRVFLVGDAAACAQAGQRVPSGYYNVETMLKSAVRHGAEVGVCGSCMDARGIAGEHLAEGTRRSSLEEWASWTVWADKVVVF
ncbi:MAG: DsrE/DsrF/TusD sulfur relay family protein [Myxococcota bacterium]